MLLLQNLLLRNFRNFVHLEVNFSSGVNVICGDNAQGKTNLLEAIYFLSTGRSFRTLNLHHLIKHHENAFLIEASFLKDGVEESLRVYFDGTNRKLWHNATLHTSFTKLLGILPSVLLAPGDFTFITGAPAIRRRQLNFHLAQYDKTYVLHLARFFKALQQRNFLLKTGDLTTIETWEHEIAASSAYIISKRHDMIEEMLLPMNELMDMLSPVKEKVRLKYAASIPYHEDPQIIYKTALDLFYKNREKESKLGVTIHGPHRDDIHISINDKPAINYASEGQKKTLLSALKLSEHRRLSAMSGMPVLMNIDDLGLHLDETRQIAFIKTLHDLPQVFITSPTTPKLWPHAKSITISGGQLL